MGRICFPRRAGRDPAVIGSRPVGFHLTLIFRDHRGDGGLQGG